MGDDEGVLVIGWNGVRVGFSVTVFVGVEKILEITRGGSGSLVGRLATVIQPNVIRLNKLNKKYRIENSGGFTPKNDFVDLDIGSKCFGRMVDYRSVTVTRSPALRPVAADGIFTRPSARARVKIRLLL